jgi:hypothetical protein
VIGIVLIHAFFRWTRRRMDEGKPGAVLARRAALHTGAFDRRLHGD